MKKILMVFTAIIVSLVIGLGVPNFLSDQTQGIEVDQTQLFAEIQQQFVEDLQVAHAEKQQDKVITETTETSTPEVDLPDVTEVTEVTEITEVTEVIDPPVDEEQNFFEIGGTPLGADNTQNAAGQQVVKDAWVQDQINENRNKISDDDLYTGAAIYNSLDTNYLFGLAADGLTEDEKVEVQAYLSANLSPDEMSIAMDLYSKYAYLLN